MTVSSGTALVIACSDSQKWDAGEKRVEAFPILQPGLPNRGRFDFSMIEVPEIRKWLQQPDIAERIVPLFQTRFRRVTWHLPIAERGRVLVQLDRGFVAARCGEREQREAISEIELELAGSEDAAVLTEIAGQLGQRIRLEPSDTSKSRRGYVLLDAVTGI